MAKFKQECIFGIRAVMEAIQDEKEIDKAMQAVHDGFGLGDV